MGIVHRDIKLENVMMSDSSDTASVRLADFGLAKFIGPDCKTKEPFGTVGYCAPEILLGQAYTINVDLWSLGCLMYAMFCEHLPFDSDVETEAILSTINDRLTFDDVQWGDFNSHGIKLIERLLEKDPIKRITVK
jgi:serine/threonine protein kinase